MLSSFYTVSRYIRNMITRKRSLKVKLLFLILIMTVIVYKGYRLRQNTLRRQMMEQLMWTFTHLREHVNRISNSGKIMDIGTYISNTAGTNGSILRYSSRHIMHAPQPNFIPGIKNPCFHFNRNILVDGYRVRRAHCLPYYYVAGFTKAGTTDFHKRLTMHQHIMMPGGKEAHFWDNLRNEDLRRVNSYLNYTNMVSQKIQKECINPKYIHGKCPYITFDATPCTVWYADRWQEETTNIGHSEPMHLTPHKIHHITPHAKIIILIRDPVERLYSDYRYYAMKSERFRSVSSSDILQYAADEFHSKVQSAIQWWNMCTEELELPRRRCAYGIDYPTKLPKLGLEVNCLNKTDCKPFKMYWNGPSADRLRIGLYHIFLRDWLKVFPKSNLLILKYEEYIKNPIMVLEKKVLPFLELEPFTAKIKYYLKVMNKIGLRGNKSYLQMQMRNDTRKLLESFYREPNNLLVELLDDEYYNYTYS